MREIKFRAWSEDTREMIQVVRLDIKEETIHYENGIKSINREQELGFWWKPYILMQYTGLKDKNGVNIYEGDIVRWHDVVTWNYSVTFKDGVFCISDDTSANFYHLKEDINEKFEVIGNIYENKDLLGKKNGNHRL